MEELKVKLQGFIDIARKDWRITHNVVPEFDHGEPDDPTTSGYVTDMSHIHFYYNVVSKASDEELMFTVYHEAGHIRQRELGVVQDADHLDCDDMVERFIRFAYVEFTDEYSSQQLLLEKNKKLIKSNIESLKKILKGIPDWMGLLRENYPYLYAHRKMGDEGSEFYEYVRSEIVKRVPEELIVELEKVFEGIELKKKDTCYYIEWDEGLNQKLRKLEILS